MGLNASVRLSAYNVCKYFGKGDRQRRVLKNISVDFDQGRSYAISGVSGVGKSTLLHLLAGLDYPTSGIITCADKNIRFFSAQVRAQRLGIVFQDPHLIYELSVGENILLAGRIIGLSYHESVVRMRDFLHVMDLKGLEDAAVSSLSGGQQQRVSVARTLLSKPSFLFADEPTGNLDEEAGNTLIDLLISCQKRWHMGLIVCSHDKYVTRVADLSFVLKNGILIRSA